MLFAAAAASNRESSGRARCRPFGSCPRCCCRSCRPRSCWRRCSCRRSWAISGRGWSPRSQLLLVVGVGYAILNCIGEALSGGGEIAFRAKVNVAWSVVTLAALLGLSRSTAFAAPRSRTSLVFVAVRRRVLHRGRAPRRNFSSPFCGRRSAFLWASWRRSGRDRRGSLRRRRAGQSRRRRPVRRRARRVLSVAAVGMYGGRARKGAATLRAALRGET